MEEKSINPAESLDIIQSMISKAQQNYSIDSFYYIMWGWLTFTAAMLSYFLYPVLRENTGLIWLLMPLGGIVSFFYGRNQSKKQKVKTYLENHVNQVWLTLGLAIISVCASIFMGVNLEIMPTFILLYGIGIFCTGRIIRFVPMMIGGALCFPLFLLCGYFTFNHGEYQFLVLALALLVSYIIPGHMLKAKFRSNAA
jgi:putative Mn2+ efflux pump MntP